MAIAPILPLFVEGNLKDHHLSLQYPINIFSKGIWQLSINSFSYKIKDKNNLKEYLCSLKCNWITNINYDKNNQLISESPFLFQFALSKRQDCVMSRYQKWYEINTLSEFFICEIYDLTSKSI